MKRAIYLLPFFSFILFSCGVSVPESYTESQELPKIYPDVIDVTIPQNIAPLTFELDEEADAYLQEQLNGVVEHKNRNFGNGRYVRNLFESCVTYQASRLSNISQPTKQQLQQLTKEDVEKAYNAVLQ